MWYNENGKLVESVSFDSNNRSFKYGDGIFETIRIFNGKIFNKENHLRRIVNSLKVVKISLPISASDLLHLAIDLASKNGIFNGGLRISIYRYSSGKYSPDSSEGRFFIESYALENLFFELNKNGLDIDYYHSHFKSPSLLSNLKTTSAIFYVLASIEKKERKLDDLLILNTEGNPIEACSSNLFIVHNQQLFTPPLESGCLDGCMRSLVLQNFDVIQKKISFKDIEESEELFLTNSNSIAWVRSIGSKQLLSSQYASKVVEMCNRLI
jgi:branched-chain amino acid aminotransferase